MNNRIPSTPPIILPLPVQEYRPLWSVMIPVYNCSAFLPEALNSVLSQALPAHDMQIEVIDDASSDADVKQIVEGISGGRVKYFRQEANVGSLRNFETCLNRARGKLIHILHGDDKIKTGFYAKLGSLFQLYPEAGAAFCRFSYINTDGKKLFDQEPEMDQDGILDNWLVRIGERQRIQYVAKVVKREVFEKIGAFYGLTYGEDWEMWVRIARYYPVAYTPQVLAKYRMHQNSISGQKFLDAHDFKDNEKAMTLIQDHLPRQHKKTILKKSQNYYANLGLNKASAFWRDSLNKKVVTSHLLLALRMDRSPDILWKGLKLYIKMLLNIV